MSARSDRGVVQVERIAPENMTGIAIGQRRVDFMKICKKTNVRELPVARRFCKCCVRIIQLQLEHDAPRDEVTGQPFVLRENSKGEWRDQPSASTLANSDVCIAERVCQWVSQNGIVHLSVDRLEAIRYCRLGTQLCYVFYQLRTAE